MIPSIDIQNGQTVQLVEGSELAVEAGSPLEIAETFDVFPEIGVVDLDAAMSKDTMDPSSTAFERKTNARIIRELVDQTTASIRLGGGIRSVEMARYWLDQGVDKIIIGSAASRDLLSQLPEKRTVVALDHRNGTVVKHGWTDTTDLRVMEAVKRFQDLTGEFLVTSVEDEGKMDQTDMAMAERLADGPVPVTIAGGIASKEEISCLSEMGHKVQLGMCLYTGELSLGEAFRAFGHSDREDRLIPTNVCDLYGRSQGIVYSSERSIEKTIETGQAHYESRSRGLWKKGETSGHTQQVHRLRWDCDRDALQVLCDTKGDAFCHEGTHGCFGDSFGLPELQRVLEDRLENRPDGSYTAQISEEGRTSEKLLEETHELLNAHDDEEDGPVHEAADLLYFVLLKLTEEGVTWKEIISELKRRHQ